MPPKQRVGSTFQQRKPSRERGEDNSDYTKRLKAWTDAKAAHDAASRQAEIDRVNASAAAERKITQDNANALENTVDETGAEVALSTAASDEVLETGQKNKRRRGGGKNQGRVVGGVASSGVLNL